MVIGTIRGRIMQMMNKNDPVPDQEMLSLTNSKKKKKVSTIFIIFLICMRKPINQLPLTEASWQVTLQFVNHQ